MPNWDGYYFSYSSQIPSGTNTAYAAQMQQQYEEYR